MDELSVCALSTLSAAVLAAAAGWRVGRQRPQRFTQSPGQRPGLGHVQAAGLDSFRAARRDTLTDLASRAAFLDDVTASLRTTEPAALLMIDIDDFSTLNAVHGLRAGDDVLRTVAERLRALLPASTQICRLDADRFALLMEFAGGLDSVEATALGILRSLGVPMPCMAAPVSCTVSLGVVLLPMLAASTDDALRAASAAVDLVKDSGGNGWRFFDPERDDTHRLQARMVEELRLGIAAGQMVPFYQPIMDLGQNRMVGLEVLARWQHPTRGLLLPDLFIPVAEAANMTGLITQTLMRRVIADARDWPDWLYFAFNVSPGQLRELIGMIRNPPLWPEGTLDPERLEVEVTESALIEDIEVAREVIALLQGRGARVVLDDFGIGYSNFFHLRELPFDRIKIDRSFVLDILHDPRAEACVRAMLALGDSLGIPMVAEGVKDAETERLVAALGCRFGQGFHYSEPVASRDVARLLQAMPGVRRPVPARF